VGGERGGGALLSGWADLASRCPIGISEGAGKAGVRMGGRMVRSGGSLGGS